MKSVIKVGGSLQDSPTLRDVCGTIEDISKDHNIVVIPGGGEFADAVRDLQDSQGLSDETAHQMAVMAMNMYGLALDELMLELPTTEDFHEIEKNNVIFLPYRKAYQDCQLERSWRVTSDSLAAWVCGELGFDRLILVKRVDGIPDHDHLRERISTEGLKDISQTVVDSKLPEVLGKYSIDCWVVNGEFPERIERLVNGEKALSTKISPVNEA